MIERVKITCSCGREFRGFPEYKWNSRIKNKQPEDCNICTNKKILFGDKNTGQKKQQKSTTKQIDNKPVRKKKKNSQKKRQIKSIDKYLDEAWSLLIKLLAGHRCEYCKNPKTLNSHHLYTRRNKSVRWSTVNGICLCAFHHTLSSKFSAHGTPFDFDVWFRKYKGNDFVDKLAIKAHSTIHWTRFEKEILLKELKKEIKCLQSK